MRRLSIIFVLALPITAQASEDDDGMCRNGVFTENNPALSLARVTARPRAHFFADMDGCPQAGARCQQRSYLVTGNKVVTGRRIGGWTCVFYPGGGGGTAGWMASSSLSVLPVNPAPTQDAWLGEWDSDGARYVTFSRKGADLRIKGTAFWPSRNVDLRSRPGGPNIGEVDGAARARGNRLHEEGCSVTFVLLGAWLAASDPTRDCDGMNVTFSGIYKRAPAKRR